MLFLVIVYKFIRRIQRGSGKRGCRGHKLESGQWRLNVFFISPIRTCFNTVLDMVIARRDTRGTDRRQSEDR